MLMYRSQMNDSKETSDGGGNINIFKGGGIINILLWESTCTVKQVLFVSGLKCKCVLQLQGQKLKRVK